MRFTPQVQSIAWKLYDRLKEERGLFLYGSWQVQAGRYLVSRKLARLEDNGKKSMDGRPGRQDGERWWLHLADGDECVEIVG